MLDVPPNPEQEKQEQIQIETEKILNEWKNSQVYLASTSGYRKKGLESVGFKGENIHTCSVPDEVEQKAFADYQQTYSPTHFDPRRTLYTAEISSAKLRALQIPDGAIGVALDTLPMVYEKNEEYGKDSLASFWLAKASPKPESAEKARQIVLDSFLLIARNYLRALKFRGKMLQGEEANEDFEDGFEEAVVYNSNIKVRTSVAIKFPQFENIISASAEVQLRPHKIRDLIEAINFEEMDESYVLDRIEPEELAKIKIGDKILEDHLKELIDGLFILMEKEGIDPTKISGGVNYGSEEVREFLGVEEVGLNDKVEEGVYLGFPKNFVEDILKKQARSLAENKV